jgi:hypothetical protein
LPRDNEGRSAIMIELLLSVAPFVPARRPGWFCKDVASACDGLIVGQRSGAAANDKVAGGIRRRNWARPPIETDAS